MPSKIDDPILKRLRQSFDCTLGQREQAAITCRELTPIIIAASTTVSSPRKTICITLTASLPLSSGFSSPYPDIITLLLTPDIITLLQQSLFSSLTELPKQTTICASIGGEPCICSRTRNLTKEGLCLSWR